MLLGLTCKLMRFITDLVLVRTRSDAQLRAEVLALRHQLRVLERKVGSPAWQPANRILLAGLSRLLPKSGLPSLLPKPETLLRWHRDLVCRKWAVFGQRPRRQRPVRDPERRALTLKLAEENPRWGYRRIQGEVVKLGFGISHMQVARIQRSHGIPPAPRRSHTTWREFVRQHADQMLACDFFTVETAWLQRLHVLFFIEIASRKVHLAGITANPIGEWVAQQARTLAWTLQDGALKAQFLLRDRRLQVHRQLRSGLRFGRRRSREAALPVPSGELDLRKVRRHLPARGTRSPAHLQRPPPGGCDQGVPGPLSPGAPPPSPRPALPGSR
jgi:putative transposase